MSRLVQAAADALFMPYVVALLLGVGLFLTLRFRFVQLRRLPEAVRLVVARPPDRAAGVLSPLQALATALAASVGTGNIAGVATAIISGGPGALFWIWVYGLVAAAIKFAEAVLGIRYRILKPNGDVASGPMYYLRDGLKSPVLAVTYAATAGVAALLTTPFTQPNSMAIALDQVFGVPPLLAGIVIALLTWLVVIGGLRSIARAAEALVPIKVALYLGSGVIVLVAFADRVPYVLHMVFREALTMRSAMGFGMFVAMRYGIARGVYANEAGFGSAAVAYGTARSTNPTVQGLQASLEVFIVSFGTATLSALAILVTGVAEASIASRASGDTFVTSTAAVAVAFDAAIPMVGGWIVAVSAVLFGYTTLIGWAYYGEQFLEYLAGRRVTMPYRWTYCLLIPFGAVLRPDVVWAWGDLLNALQIFPNLVGLVVLSGLVARHARS